MAILPIDAARNEVAAQPFADRHTASARTHPVFEAAREPYLSEFSARAVAD